MFKRYLPKDIFASRLKSCKMIPLPFKKDKLSKLIDESKVLSKLAHNPRFNNYFNKFKGEGAASIISSFLILHEITAVIPLCTIWWFIYTTDITESEVPEYLSRILNKIVTNEYLNDKKGLITSGAISYGIVKLMYPLRIFLSLWGAPYFSRWVIRPLKQLVYRKNV